ncbi:MAG: DUF4423 domain-containing protein [Oligoflexales bacterium]
MKAAGKKIKVTKTWLADEYARRKETNPSYSIRSYAADLGLTKTVMTDLLHEKRALSRRAAKQIASKLGFSPAETEQFLKDLGIRPTRRTEKSEKSEQELTIRQLKEDQWRLISDWYHIAIMRLIQTREKNHDEDFIGEQLGLSNVEVKAAISRLHRLGLIEIKGDTITRAYDLVKVGGEGSSMAVRKYHLQNLELASKSLEHDPVEERFFNAITLAIDPNQLDEFEQKINEFCDTFAPKNPGKRSVVYTLAVQFFRPRRSPK